MKKYKFDIIIQFYNGYGIVKLLKLIKTKLKKRKNLILFYAMIIKKITFLNI